MSNAVPGGDGNTELGRQSILGLHNMKSVVGSFYDMLTPVQMTMETIDSRNFSCTIFSPEDHYTYITPRDSFCATFNTRPMHHHSFFELMLVLDGTVTQRIEGKDYHYPAGACCLIDRNTQHTERMTDVCTVLFLGMSAAFVEQLQAVAQAACSTSERAAYDHAVFRFLTDNLYSSEHKRYLDIYPAPNAPKPRHTLQRLCDALAEQIVGRYAGATSMIYGLTHQLLAHLGDPAQYCITPVERDFQPDYLLFSRISHMLEDTHGRMSRAELECALHYSGNYLNSIVGKYSGLCLFDYGMTFCLRHAAALLQNTQLPITEILAQLGFTNRTHFYKLFREHYHMTPQQYRTAQQNAVQTQ